MNNLLQNNCIINSEILQEKKLTDLKKNSIEMAAIISDIDEKKNFRMKNCATVLTFKNFPKIHYRKLFKAFMCKIRICPFCMTRKSILMNNNLNKTLKVGFEENQLEYIHLVLAQKNCEILNLNSELDFILEAFSKLRKRDVFAFKGKGAKNIIKGWYRNIEITLNEKEKSFHPHIHCILAVDKSYFYKNNSSYITHKEWIKLWKESLGIDYDPTANISKIYYLDENGEKIKNITNGEQLEKATKEASKYVTKPLDILDIDDIDFQKKVIKSLLLSIAYRRLYAYGGILKEIRANLRLEDEEKATLIDLGDEVIDTAGMEYFIELFKWCNENGGNYKKFLEFTSEEYSQVEKGFEAEIEALKNLKVLKLNKKKVR